MEERAREPTQESGVDASSRTATFVEWAVRRGRTLWLIAVALAIPATLVMIGQYRHLKSDLEELLPPNAPSVQAMREMRTRMPGLGVLGVVVDTGRPENVSAAERMLDELAARVRQYPRRLVFDVRSSIEEAHRFVRQHAPLYMEVEDLRAVSARIAQRKSWEAKKRFDILLDDEPPPPLDFSDIRQKYESKVSGAETLPEGRFSRPDKNLTLLLIQTDSTTAHASRELLSRVKDDLRALGGPERYAPGMRIGFAGSVPTAVEELAALASDLKVSSTLVVGAVLAAILLFYRWWRIIPALFAPLGIATVLAFGVAALLGVERLNSSTAFLGSIVVGNGLNVGVILAARYVEARRRGKEVHPALWEAVGGARTGTLVAMLAAATAYTSLVISSFRGFRQFGILGAAGMLLCWVCAFLLTPSLLARLDRGPETAPRPRRHERHLMAHVASAVARHPAAFMAAAALVTIASLAELARFDTSHIETNFGRLRRKDTWTSGEGYWGKQMSVVLGTSPASLVMMTDSREEAARLAATLKKRIASPALQEILSRVRSLESVVPPDQPEKLALVRRIRQQITPTVRQHLTPEQLARIDEFLGKGPVQTFTAADVPAMMKAGLQERDGTVGRTLIVYATTGRTVWEANRLEHLVGSVRKAAAEGVGPEGRPARVAGALTVTADIVRSFRHDGPLTSLLALVCVMVCVGFAFRWQRTSLYVIGSLILGVVWMAGLDMAVGVKLNYANFIAFPITFGIGVDYAANVIARYRQEGGRDVRPAIASTGGAVALCSLTTIIGYSSLLLASNRGLFLFGFVAVSGEICCLAAAVVALPAVLAVGGWLRARYRRHRTETAEAV